MSPAAPTNRPGKRARIDPLAAGLPDPRPITDYIAEWAMVGTGGDVLRLTITLMQPCVIGLPQWPVVDYVDGARYQPSSTKVNSNTSFSMDFDPSVPGSANFVEPPYQDLEVRNFQGGFVRPGAKWFRY